MIASDNVLISSKGYGFNPEGEVQETSVLRHHIPEVAPGEYALIEPIDPNVFHLNNEYWVSYYIQERIFDKKFVFPPEMIEEENYVYIKQIDLEGILQ